MKKVQVKEYNVEYKRFSLARYTSLIRNFRPADVITIMNGMCGMLSILYCIEYQTTRDLKVALLLPFFGLVFDIFDGRVARWSGSTSMLGQQLDSLADLVSFGVAPASLGYSLGLNTLLDKVILAFFVCCGLARLGRYNVTAHLLKDEKGGVKYFEGFPIPSTLMIVIILSVYYHFQWQMTRFVLLGFDIHYFTLVYLMWAICMVSSNIKVPKL